MFDQTATYIYRDAGWTAGTNFFSDSASARIRSGNQLEGDVSRMLTCFTEDLADALARIFLDFGQADALGADPDVWVGHEWLAATGSRLPGDRRSPDIIIATRGDMRRVLLVIELKGRVWVNGHRDYCKAHCETLGYANQIICYAANCWTGVDLEGVPRLVIGPDRHRDSFGGWGRRGLVPEDDQRYGLGAAFAAQQRACTQWHFAGLRELVSRIELIDDSPAKRVALEVLVGWLTRIDL